MPSDHPLLNLDVADGHGISALGRADLTGSLVRRRLCNVAGFGGEAALIDEVRQRLSRKFGDVPHDQISSAVTQAHNRFAHSKVRDFVPLLVERRVSDALSAADRK